MVIALSRIFRSPVAASALVILLAAGVAHSTGSRQIDNPLRSATAAEEAFPEAPFGVDPVVTGPTSSAFRKRQVYLDCADRIWPDVPLACYPGR